MKNIFKEAIPTIERMIEKQRDHISFLQSIIDGYRGIEWKVFGYKLFDYSKDIERIQSKIDISNIYLNHYITRLDEYKKASDLFDKNGK